MKPIVVMEGRAPDLALDLLEHVADLLLHELAIELITAFIAIHLDAMLRLCETAGHLVAAARRALVKLDAVLGLDELTRVDIPAAFRRFVPGKAIFRLRELITNAIAVGVLSASRKSLIEREHRVIFIFVSRRERLASQPCRDGSHHEKGENKLEGHVSFVFGCL